MFATYLCTHLPVHISHGALKAVISTPILLFILTLLSVIFLAILRLFYHLSEHSLKSKHVPAASQSNSSLGLLYGSLKLILSARLLLRRGYEKYRTRTFKVAEFAKWRVIVNTPELIEELCRASEDTMSLVESLKESLATEYTLCPSYPMNSISALTTKVIRGPLTKNIGLIFPDVMDEIACAFDDNLVEVGENDWKSFPALDTLMNVVSRTTNRIIVGTPLCRNKAFVELNIRFTVDVMMSAYIVTLLPSFLKRPASRFISYLQGTRCRANTYLKPFIERRLEAVRVYGRKSAQLPVDVLTWAIEQASDDNLTVEYLSQVLLIINFAAVHTSSMSITQALLHLAANRNYMAPLREEIIEAVRAEGWTKRALDKMVRVDSFLKESQRFHGIGMIAPQRRVMKDYTLSDGTFLPAGTLVGGNATHVHRDERWYQSADEFDGFRFVSYKQNGSFVNTSATYLTFGHGRHACPGRFFASTELKAMMAHLIANYDFRIDGPDAYPPNFEFTYAVCPSQKANILFKKISAW